MSSARILILNFDPLKNLADQLLNAVGSSGYFNLSIQHRAGDDLNPQFYDADLSNIISREGSEMLLFILPCVLLKPALGLFEKIRKALPGLPIIVVTDTDDPDELIEITRAGISDFMIAPFKSIDVQARIGRLLSHNRDEERLTRTLTEKHALRQIVGESPCFLDVVNKIPVVANTDASVLISGETGTGKDMCARAIHYLSLRSGKPFIAVNCGAIPVDLVENELFGHRRGAFTSAFDAQRGLIEEADGGTIFLDEIDCLPTSAQVKLLRFLQEKEYRPLGSAKMRKADVRVISAANVNFEKAVKEGSFRKDLYYRLNIIRLRLPPLRDRREDIPVLARHFLAKYRSKFNKKAMELSPDALQTFFLHDWPGNVRELEYIIERAVVMSEDDIIRCRDIISPDFDAPPPEMSFQEAKAEAIVQFEKSYICALLHAHNGNITKAAMAAQKNRRAFWQLIRRHRIDAQKYKPGAQ